MSASSFKALAGLRVGLGLALLFAAACGSPERPELGGPSGAGAGSDGLPAGTVVAFSGTEIPAGWTVCDGGTTPTGLPTPDLRERFVLGTVPGPDVGQPGGALEHTHTGSTGEADGGRVGADKDNDVFPSSSRHQHSLTVDAAQTLPPHVRLVYIMKD